MKKLVGIALSVLFVVAVIALTFRVAKIRTLVTGA